MIDGGTLHIVLTSGLSAIGVVAGWALLTTIRLDKDVAVLKREVGNGLGKRFDELKDRLNALEVKLDGQREQVLSKIDSIANQIRNE